jgi:predicted acyltransferase
MVKFDWFGRQLRILATVFSCFPKDTVPSSMYASFLLVGIGVSLIFIGLGWCKVDSDWLGTKTLKQNKSVTLASLLFKITIKNV